MNTVAKLEREVDLLRTKLAERDAQLASMHEQIRLLLHRKLSTSSEKNPPNQLGLFNEAAAESDSKQDDQQSEERTTSVSAHQRR